jgi:hypothetical protein
MSGTAPATPATPADVPATPVLNGSCFCGKVRFQCSGKKISCVHCHCTICQRLHGARFATVALFEHFELLGDSKDHVVEHKTSDVLTRCVCKSCHAPAYNVVGQFGHGTPVSNFERDKRGRLLHADLLKPMAHIFYADRVADVIDDLPKMASKPPDYTMLTSDGQVIPPPQQK